MVLEKTRESLSSIASEKLDAMPRSARYARVILVGRCTIRGYAAISAIKVCSDGNSKSPKLKKREKGNGFTSVQGLKREGGIWEGKGLLLRF